MSEILREIILAELEQEEIADGIEAPLMQVQETEDIPQVTAKLMAMSMPHAAQYFQSP